MMRDPAFESQPASPLLDRKPEHNPYLEGKRDGISELANSVALLIFFAKEAIEEWQAIKKVGEDG